MERLSMRKIKQVLRLHFEQAASNRRIAMSTHIISILQNTSYN